MMNDIFKIPGSPPAASVMNLSVTLLFGHHATNYCYQGETSVKERRALVYTAIYGTDTVNEQQAGFWHKPLHKSISFKSLFKQSVYFM